MTAIVFGMVLPWPLIAVGAWLGFQLVRQNGRLLLRLEAIEERLSPRAVEKRREAGGLPIGGAAPDFDLPDLSGVRRRLSEFRGRDVLLVFFNPQCGHCTEMTAGLAALPPEGGGDRPVPIVVSTGDAEENRKLVERFGVQCLVLLQEGMEIASKFRAQGTPMGYRIDEAGRIASELTVGAEPLLQLAAASVVEPNGEGASGDGSTPGGGKGDPSLARSRLGRNGLKAGAAAPDFRLPRVDGGELSLADLRGRRVLLVFSDPNCGPCDELAPRLQEIHLRRPNVQVLVVGRRDVEANRAKAIALGLTYPIVLQRQWEVSMLYAKFATPVGYLIDERGVLASDLAVGVGTILALVEEPATGSDVAAESPTVRREHARAC